MDFHNGCLPGAVRLVLVSVSIFCVSGLVGVYPSSGCVLTLLSTNVQYCTIAVLLSLKYKIISYYYYCTRVKLCSPL